MTAPVILHASTPEHYEAARGLFLEYAEELGVDLCFQGFDEELATLPGRYAPPSGRLLLALVDDAIVGCVGLRRIDDGTCEMKRMYLKPSHRGSGAGRLLADSIIEEARAMGYSAMRLDTLRSLRSARRIYAALGFREIDPYYDNPHGDVEYLELRLDEANEP